MAWFTNRFRQRPSVVDLAMIVAAASWYVYRTTGPGLQAMIFNLLVWIALWILWFILKSNLIGPAFSLGVLVLMFFGPKWQVALELERDCMTKRGQAAIAAHASEVEPRLRFNNFEYDGNCGLLDYRKLTTIEARIEGREHDDPDRIVVATFRGSGTGFVLFGGKGFLYSPGGRPACRDIASHERPEPCVITPHGDAWYSYRHAGDLN